MRKLKQELPDFYEKEVQRMELNADECTIKNIHTAYVTDYVKNEPPNRVLQREISQRVQQLARIDKMENEQLQKVMAIK